MVRLCKNTLFLIGLILFASCTLGFLNDGDGDGDDTAGDTSRTVYDETTGTLSYYSDDSADSLEWVEYYDFNIDGRCIFVRHETASGTLVWSEVYGYDDEGNLDMEAHYGADDALDYYTVTLWEGGNAVQQALFDSSDNHEGFDAWNYDSNDRMTGASYFDDAEDLEYAYKYNYDYSGDNLTYLYAARFDGTFARTSYYENHYEILSGIDEISTRTGYGDCESSADYVTSFSATCFPEYNAANDEVRNTSGLTEPSGYTMPAVPALTLVDTSLDYAWMTIMAYDPWGYTLATLNGDYMPVYLERSAPDYLDDVIATELVYDTEYIRPVSKTVTYGDTTVLELAFTYDSAAYPNAPEGSLNQVDLSGDGMLLPLSIFASYYDTGVPESLSVSSLGNTDSPFYVFTYDYIDPTSIDPDADYVQQVASVTLSDGDGIVQRYFTFTYDSDNRNVTIAVWETDDIQTDTAAVGSIVLAYDEEGSAVGLTAYNSEDGIEWAFEYGYEDVVETAEGLIATAEDIAGDYDELYQVMIGETFLGGEDQPGDISEFFSDSGVIDIALTFLADMDLMQYVPVDLSVLTD